MTGIFSILLDCKMRMRPMSNLPSHKLTMNITWSKMFYCRTFEFEQRWREDPGAEGTERGGVCNVWKSCPIPTRGMCSLPRNILEFKSPNRDFWYIMGTFFRNSIACFTLIMTSFRCWNVLFWLLRILYGTW